MSTDDPDNSSFEQESDEPTSANPGSYDLNLQDLQIDEDLRSSYLSYAMSVIVSRALPDVRDGLKPSQRRILLAMNDLNLHSSAKEVKCAKICGDTSGNYHPHGEAIVYPTLVRMGQPFNMRYPLISPQGNFGSIDGLPPAAMRYTEARMSKVAEQLLLDIEKETVDTIPSYDDARQEAVVLPGRFPNLLCNGSSGIAVGMATSIPPHNVGEVCEAIIRLIDNPNLTLAELLEIVPGPDFPTGGVICGRRGIVEGYKNGRSNISVRGRCTIEENEKSGRASIIVTEIPFMQQKIRLIQKIADSVKEDKVKGVTNVQDHSDRHGMRIVIDVKRDADPNVVLNQLYQFTPLQDTFSIILIALIDGRPQTFSLKQMLVEFIEHRVTVIRRRTQYLLRKARNRAHVLEGLLIALSDIDEVIQRIRQSKDVPEARERLMSLEVSAELLNRALGDEGFQAFQAIMGAQATYNLSRAQADSILQMQLQRLTALESDKLIKEYKEIREEITSYETLLADERNLLAVVRSDTLEIRDKFGDKRRTEIVEWDGDLNLEDLIADETNVVTISHDGYIKRLSIDTYRTQGRGGKGVTGGQTKQGDFLQDVFVASTHDYVLFFTNMGQCLWLKVYDIPSQSRTAQGRALVNLLTLRPGETISSHIPVRIFDEERSLFMITKRGIVKKTPLVAYSRPKQGGIIGISISEDDELIGVLLTKPGDHVILATKSGMSIRFEESDARNMGRNTTGVKGITLDEGDEVVGGVVVVPGGSLLTVCENGFGKRTAFDEYRDQNRGGKGIIDIKTTERNGSVVAVAAVDETDDVMLISAGGMVVRITVAGVSLIGRNTQGVRLMNLTDDRVVSMTKIAPEEVKDEPLADAADVPVASAAKQPGETETPDLADPEPESSAEEPPTNEEPASE